MMEGENQLLKVITPIMYTVMHTHTVNVNKQANRVRNKGLDK